MYLWYVLEKIIYMQLEIQIWSLAEFWIEYRDLGTHPILAIILATSEVTYTLVETMGTDDIAQEKCVVWKGKASFLKVE